MNWPKGWMRPSIRASGDREGAGDDLSIRRLYLLAPVDEHSAAAAVPGASAVALQRTADPNGDGHALP